MQGNTKIGLLGEGVASLRAKQGMKYNNYFETLRGKLLYFLVDLCIPQHMIEERADISRAFAQILDSYKPEQVVELGSGGSVLGLEYASMNPQTLYIESDLPQIAQWKREKLKEVRAKERLKDYGNHFVKSIDVLADDIYSVVGRDLTEGKRTLVVAEYLITYLDSAQHEKLVENVSAFLGYIGGGSYLFNDSGAIMQRDIQAGFRGKLLSRAVQKITTKFNMHFKNPQYASFYFRKKGFKTFKTLPDILDKREIKHLENLPIYLVSK